MADRNKTKINFFKFFGGGLFILALLIFGFYLNLPQTKAQDNGCDVACCQDSDCGSGQICIHAGSSNANCVEPTPTPTPTPEGYCTNDNDCTGSGQACNTYSSTCVYPICGANADCAFTCPDTGTVVYGGCRNPWTGNAYCDYSYVVCPTPTPPPTPITTPTPISCSAPYPGPGAVNGQCGSANGSNFYSQPSSNLCSSGSQTSVSGSGPWTWSCNGVNGSSVNASCGAGLSVDGVCGSANGTTVASQPTTNLCSAGNASSVSGSGPWTWQCDGLNNGTVVSCGANKIIQAIKATTCTCTSLTYNPATSGFSTNINGPASGNLTITPGQQFYAFVDYGQQTDAISGAITASGHTCVWNQNSAWVGTAARFDCGTSLPIGSYTYTTGTNNYPPPGSNICATTTAQNIGVVTVSPTPVCDSTPGTNYMKGCVYSGTNLDSGGSYIGAASPGPTLNPPADNGMALPFTDVIGTNGSTVANQTTNFSVRWKGNFTFSGGTYQFSAGSDDGERVYIDNDKIWDAAWGGRGYTVDQFSTTTTPGVHTITYEYNQGGGGADYSLGWTRTSGPTVPTVSLSASVDNGSTYSHSPPNTTVGMPIYLKWTTTGIQTGSCNLSVSTTTEAVADNDTTGHQYDTLPYTGFTYALTCTGTDGNPYSDTVTVNTNLSSHQDLCINVSAPATIAAGQNFIASTTLQNVGSDTWQSVSVNPSQPYRLGSQNPQDNGTWGLGRVDLPVNTVAPGQQTTFTINATAPTTPGTYPFSWDMVQDGVAWFNSPFCSQNIDVHSGPSNLSGSVGSGPYCGYIQLTWGAAAGASGYDIYRSTTVSKPSSPYDSTTTTSYIDKSPDSGGDYYWVAVSGAGPSGAIAAAGSPVLAADPSSCGSGPGTPGSPQAVNSGGSLTCDQIQISWAPSTGTAPIDYKVLWTDNQSDFLANNYAAAKYTWSNAGSPLLDNFSSHPAPSGGINYYWVEAENAYGHTFVKVPPFGISSIACTSDLTASNKQVVEVNGIVQTGNAQNVCNGNAVSFNPGTTLAEGDVVKFAVNLCNTGAATSSNVSLTDLMTNLSQAGNFLYNNAALPSGMNITTITTLANGQSQFTVTGIPPLPPKDSSGNPGIGTLTYTAKLQNLNGSVGSIAKFQNYIPVLNYAYGPWPFGTPQINFSLGSSAPVIKETK